MCRMSVFKFDPVNHMYTLDGRPLPSVTDVLRDNRFINPEFYTEEGRQRGAAVHAATHYDDLGRLKWSSLHSDLHGYVHSWQKFKATMQLNIIDIEVPRYHPLYLYAGTLDRRVLIGGYEWILDLKTGKAPKWAAFQTAAYDLLAGPTGKERQRKRAAVELQADGTVANLIQHTDLNDAGFFLAFVSTTMKRREYGIRSDDHRA